jgi:coproporphyrinogen III oxidase-like Fe-S oxidoreductase
VTSRDLLTYVNVPFCAGKCHFCDWVQQVPTADLRLTSTSPRRVRYIEALRHQILTLAPGMLGAGYVPRILYFGGGTATILTPAELRAVMEAVGELVDFAQIDEATIEGSPETITDEKLETYLEAGFNRISLGIQTLDDRRLRRLARRHDAAQAAEAVRQARRAGFRDISIDLISGLPGETLAEFEGSLRRVLELPFDHVSLYPYRPAAGTVARRQLRNQHEQVDLEEQLAAYALASELLAGYDEYAFGHFGRPISRSDMAYFGLQMDWIGFGSGASSLLGGRLRKTSKGALDGYIGDPLAVDMDLPATAPVATRHMLYEALTTPDGARADRWAERTGGTLAQALRQIPAVKLVEYLRREAGLVSDERGVRVPTDRIPAAYIKLLYLNTPREGRRRRELAALTGGS